jgi:hypothetical protein
MEKVLKPFLFVAGGHAPLRVRAGTPALQTARQRLRAAQNRMRRREDFTGVHGQNE